MQWSNILKTQQVEKIDSDISVIQYVPKEFNLGTSDSAQEYLKKKKAGSDFTMSDVVRHTTGVEEIERLSEEQNIEQKVLEKLATLQEQAYQEAYQLGLEEGRAKAYAEKQQELDEQISGFSNLSHSLNSIKEELVRQNEAHIFRMIYEIASRIAFDHIQEHQESVLQVIKKAIETAQAEENINVRVSNQQIEMLEKEKLKNNKETEFLRNVKFEPSEQISIGSCVVETNYGVIDARVEERINKLWDELKEAMPKVKSITTPDT